MTKGLVIKFVWTVQNEIERPFVQELLTISERWDKMAAQSDILVIVSPDTNLNSCSHTKSPSQELRKPGGEITVPGYSIIRKDALKKAGRKELFVSFLPQPEGVQHGERCLPHLPYRKERALNLDLRLETQYQTHYNKIRAERGPMCLPAAD